MPVPRKTELHRRRVRRIKLAKLRTRYVRAKSDQERAKIWEKVVRVHPLLTREDFLAPARAREQATRTFGEEE